nr:MAG TPA: hypothetical protein [Crassvirales sp.]
MAKQSSLNIADYLNDTVMDNLAEILDGVIENIQAGCVSEALKAKNGSGDPTTGSVEYKRFANATLQEKGTARTNGKGNKVKAKPVVVKIDDDKEIIEELQEKDLKLYGVDGMAKKRSANAKNVIKTYYDRKFFKIARDAGVQVARVSGDTTKKIVDRLISTAKVTKNDFVDGVDEELIALVVNTSYKSDLKDYLDSLPNGTSPSNGAIGMYQSVITYESNRMPSDVPAMVMLKEAIALPNYTSEYEAEKVPFDDAIALELFAYSGGEALVPEIILYDCDYTYTKAEISSFAAGTTYYIYEFGEYSAVPSTATFDSSETYYTRA